ncbi:ribonuclease HII [Polynucleobacter sp. MWH-Spelu-300-X4]|jgi:ribonuclease HII|uniref:ribonuclease HII n=1 Tax=Polynucleobacter sp. MWH-Spelu-300-X4 TaxID=2689109 RepID=UPI001BFD2480|nr:ribonuclease HII [Polynucleobacter sp. MWH-Spelu-300-X4]QWD78948.1 ribonuclease HII [Polynucleobacter sp. MWH-Spelu-300-X4]
MLFMLNDEVVCGVDEAGRGPLAGSVVAAAVVLNPAKPISGLKDSKKLTAKAREDLYELIIRDALAWSIAEASAVEIDSINILQATMLAMKRAVEGLEKMLGTMPDKALIDGNRCPQLNIEMEAIIKGDSKVQSISAASILAKVKRDRDMHQLHLRYPMYGFDQHMGYPTQAHFLALNQFGPCPEHRRSFAPVKAALEVKLL